MPTNTCLKRACPGLISLFVNSGPVWLDSDHDDKPLRKECLCEGIPTQYEFYLIFELVKTGMLAKTDDGNFIRSVCPSNHRISEAVKQEAQNKLAEL